MRHCLGCQEQTPNRHQLCEACQERGVRVTDETVEVPIEITWRGLFGIDPDYCGGMDVTEWLDKNRGDA